MKGKLLYITAVQPQRDKPALTEATRSVISILSRDFEISLAVAGPASTADLNSLRTDLGVVRVAGGFERGDGDTPVDPELKLLLEGRGVSTLVNARLKAAIQRRAADFESVVVDSLDAIPYLPLGISGRTVFFVQRIESDSPALAKGLLGSRRVKRIRRYEHGNLSRCDRVFSTTDVSKDLLALGISLGKLVDESTPPSSARPTAVVSGFTATRMRIGYAGYLGDSSNVNSLLWFVDNVWSGIRDAIPGLELHVLGLDASDELVNDLASRNDVLLHRDSNDLKITELGIRAMVEPLLNERHVEAKLVNAMVRGIPLATTREAVSNARLELGDSVSIADSPAHMVLNLRRILSEATLWQALSDRSLQMGSGLLAYHEVAHAMRRYLLRDFANQGDRK
jgi:hypothetical protein